MNLYSHLVLAKRLEPQLAPEDPGEFFWGTVAPDIRYLAGIRRAQTHLSREQIEAFLAQYPHLGSFILGYRVHCLLDELDLNRIIGSKFPLSLVRSRLSPRKTAVLVELYYQETDHFCPQIQGTHNALLGDLGIRPDHANVFARALNDYCSHPSLQSMISAAQSTGLMADTRVQNVIKAAESIFRSRLVKDLLFFSVRNAHLDEIAETHVRSSLLDSGVGLL